MSDVGEPPPLKLSLRFTWCQYGDHTTCPGTLGSGVCSCSCHLSEAAA